MNRDIPKVLDWVSMRAACNVGKIFDELCVGINNDVKAINSAKKLGEHDHFVAQMTPDSNSIVVGQESRYRRVVVKIGIIEDSIKVVDPIKQQEWSVQVSLNEEGRCILRLKNDELEQWQFRKKALEGMFFGD